MGATLRINSCWERGASERTSASNNSTLLGMRPKYEGTIQELKTWRPMLCITVIAFRSTAVIDNILKEIEAIFNNFRFVTVAGGTQLTRRYSEIYKGRIQVTDRTNAGRDDTEKEKVRTEGIIADRQYFFPGDEIQENFENSNIIIQEISND